MIDFLMFVTVARGIRRFIESRQKLAGKRQASEVSAFPALRTPSDDFHDHVWLPLCQRVAELAEVYHDEVWLPLCNMIAGHAVRLGRPLRVEERVRIWRSRSSLVLETLLKEVEKTNRMEVLERGLADLPSGLDRPDPTGWCEHGP